MTQIRIVDRHRKPLEIGQKLRVQHCVGRYGQVRIDEGVIDQIDTTFRGVTIKLTQPGYRYFRDRREPVAAGQPLYLALSGEFDIARGQFHCYRKHDDFEHGHEAWAEIVD